MEACWLKVHAAFLSATKRRRSRLATESAIIEDGDDVRYELRGTPKSGGGRAKGHGVFRNSQAMESTPTLKK